MPRKIDVTTGSGNVFNDLGFDRPAEELTKVQLASEINDIIEERKLTQIQAAKLLGIDQPKISALNRGRLAGFSIERLLAFLIALNNDIDIVIKPRSEPATGIGVIHVCHEQESRYA